MSTERCLKTPGVACVRSPGHQGVCSACPSPATLDFDRNHRGTAEQIDAAASLLMLDWPSPDWADLNDDV